MNKILFSYFFILFSQFGFAQQINLKGNIVIDNLEESISLKDILIINKKTEETALTDENGNFNIKVRLNDELIITSNFTDKRQIKINENILQKGSIELHLNLEIIQLAEANVKPLKKNLKDNVSKSESEKTSFYKSLGLDPNLQYIEVNPNMTSTINHNGWGQDPSLWIAALTGQRKRDVKKDEFFKTENKLSDLKDFFTENYFLDNLKIPKHKIDEFIKFCYGNKALNLNKLIDALRYLEIEEIFENEAPKYLKLLE